LYVLGVFMHSITLKKEEEGHSLHELSVCNKLV